MSQEQSWFLDNWYSRHMSGTKSTFLDLQRHEGDKVPFVGANKGNITSIGFLGI